MLYPAYEWHRRLTEPARISSELLHRTLSGLPAPVAQLAGTRRLRAVSEIVAGARPTHVRPDWGIDAVTIAGESVPVDVQPVLATPFATLLHFATTGVTGRTPMLVVGPISGHFATLLRPTVRTLLADHDVYVLDWHNARDIPVAEGRFGLDEYIDHVLAAMRHLGPDHHALAVCQPAPLVLSAVAVLAAADDPAQPRPTTPPGTSPGLLATAVALRLAVPHGEVATHAWPWPADLGDLQAVSRVLAALRESARLEAPARVA